MKVYKPKYKRPEDDIKDKDGFTEADLERAKIFEKNLKVQRHQEWKTSDYYNHVIGIIEKWRDDMIKVDQFSVDALLKATPEEVKERMVMAAKVKVEVNKLIKMLS